MMFYNKASKHQEDSQARLEEEWEQDEEMKEKSTKKRENNQQRKSKVCECLTMNS